MKTNKLLIAVTIIAFLISILPMAVLADQESETGRPENKGAVQSELARGKKLDATETEDVDASEDRGPNEKANARAKHVKIRNAYAKAQGIPPGLLNLFDRLNDLKDSESEEGAENAYDEFLDENSELTVQELFKLMHNELRQNEQMESKDDADDDDDDDDDDE